MRQPGVHVCVVAACCFGFLWPKQSQGWGSLMCVSFFALIGAGLCSVDLVCSIALVICYPNDVWVGGDRLQLSCPLQFPEDNANSLINYLLSNRTIVTRTENRASICCIIMIFTPKPTHLDLSSYQEINSILPVAEAKNLMPSLNSLFHSYKTASRLANLVSSTHEIDPKLKIRPFLTTPPHTPLVFPLPAFSSNLSSLPQIPRRFPFFRHLGPSAPSPCRHPHIPTFTPSGMGLNSLTTMLSQTFLHHSPSDFHSSSLHLNYLFSFLITPTFSLIP